MHDKTLTASARALLAAGKHLQKKDGEDPFEILTKKFGDHTDEVIRRIGKTDEAMTEVKEQVTALEQKMARGGGGGRPVQAKSWGEQFTDHDGLKAFAEETSRPARFRLDLKTTITNDAASAGALGTPTRDATNLLPKRRMTVRDLLPVISVSSNTIEYPNQTGRTNNAATVAEGAAKPESALAFDLQTVATQVIAHWIPASRQVMDDVPQLRDLIDTELRYGLMLAEETQLLNGDGTGSNLSGLITNATAFADPLTQASPTMIDQIGAAILQNALAEYPADGIMMHPSDWMRMRLLKDGDGKYILGNPQANVTPNLFGLPVVTTQAMTVDKFLVGNFQAAATLYDRWQPRVEISTEHADFFTKNLVAILAEERLGLAVKNATALTYGDFGNVA
ncbi:phage major capsid protein [Tranquillimonas alkanivorans]|nr:phage major capsid protein [Tranquillimonas alkanivorans]